MKYERTKNYVVMRIVNPDLYNWEKIVSEKKRVILFSDSVELFPDVERRIGREKILLCASCTRDHLGKEQYKKHRDILVGYGFIYDVISEGAKIILEFDRESLDEIIELLQAIKENIEVHDFLERKKR